MKIKDKLLFKIWFHVDIHQYLNTQTSLVLQAITKIGTNTFD